MEFQKLIHYLALNPELCIRVYRGRDGAETVQLCRLGGEWNYDVICITEDSLGELEKYAIEHTPNIDRME